MWLVELNSCAHNCAEQLRVGFASSFTDNTLLECGMFELKECHSYIDIGITIRIQLVQFLYDTSNIMSLVLIC
jgi:hypothetical protein